MQGRLLVIVKIYLTFDWVLLVLLANDMNLLLLDHWTLNKKLLSDNNNN